MAPTSNQVYILQAEPCLLSVLACARSGDTLEPNAWHVERGEWAVEDGSLGTALKAFTDAHIPAGAALYSVLPRHEITTRIISLPTSDPAEVASMILLSAEEYVPFSQQELVVDQAVLTSFRDGTSRVMAAFAHKDVVEGHVSLLRSAGLEPERIFLSSACLASAVAASTGEKPPRYALVNLGASGLEVAIFGETGLQYGRGVSTRQDWSLEGEKGGEALEEFVLEVRASLSAHRRESEDGLGAETVYVSSDWADVTALCDSAQHELGVAVLPAPFSKKVEGGVLAPLTLVGGACSAAGKGKVVISLVPKSLEDARAQAATNQKMKRVGAMIGAAVLLAAALFGQAVWQRKAYIAELEKQAARIAPEAESTRIKQRQLQVLRRQVDASQSVLELMAKIATVVPQGCNIDRFLFREEGLTVEGRAQTGAISAEFAESIRSSAIDEFAILADAGVTNTGVGQERGTTVYLYTIEIPFTSPDDEEGESGE